MAILILWFGCGIIAAIIASGKGRSGCGWAILGFLFGPFGILGAAVMSSDRRKARRGERYCPTCVGIIFNHATKCPHCGSDV